MNTQAVGLIVMFVFQLLSGASPVVIKNVNPGLPPMLFVFFRMGIAAVTLAILAKGLHVPKLEGISLKQKLGIILVGVLGSGIASSLFVYGVHTVGAGITNLLSELEIPISIAIASVVLKEKLTPWFYLCAGQIIIGFILVTGVSIGKNFPLGIFAVVLAAVIWGVCTVLGKILLNDGKIPPITLAKLRGFYGSLAAFVLSLPAMGTGYNSLIHLSLHDWLGIIYTGAMVSGIGFWMYYVAVKQLPVKMSSLMLIIAPVTTLILANFIAGETLSVYQWIGVVLLLFGIMQIVLKKEHV